MFLFLSEYKKKINIHLASSFILIFSYFVILCCFFLFYLIEMLLHRQKLYCGKSIFFMMFFFFVQPKNKDQNPCCTRMEIAKWVIVKSLKVEQMSACLIYRTYYFITL